MANIVDLLGSGTLVTKRNQSMSKPYMFYQLLSLAASILSPSTVILMITGCLTVLLDVHPNGAMIMAVIPPAVFLGVSFKIKSDTQILIAAVMSTMYAFIMLIAALVVIGAMVKDQTVLTPGSIFLLTLAVIYTVTALLHPQEVAVVIYGLLYIISIPSAYLLLAIYSMVNMNNVSWGTRETAPPAGATTTPAAPPEKAKSAFARFFSCPRCCGKSCCRGSDVQPIIPEDAQEEETWEEETQAEDLKEKETQAEESGDVQTDHRNVDAMDGVNTFEDEQQSLQEPIYEAPDLGWVSQLQGLSEDVRLREDVLPSDEEQFFRELIAKYLEPLPADKRKQQIMADELKSLRNKITFVYFICNAFWLLTTFVLQLLDSVAIRVPKLDSSLQSTGDYVYIEPVAFMFILAFAFLVLLQFVTVLYHRMSTLIHFVAFLDTEPTAQAHRKAEDDEDDPRSWSFDRGMLV